MFLRRSVAGLLRTVCLLARGHCVTLCYESATQFPFFSVFVAVRFVILWVLRFMLCFVSNSTSYLNLKTAFFWDVTLRSPAEIFGLFGGSCCFCHQVEESGGRGFVQYHPQRRQIFTKPHEVTFQTAVIFILLALRISRILISLNTCRFY